MSPEEDLADILSENNITISIAESCTGGMLGSKITSLPGSSRYFLGGVITYSNGSKENILGVEEKTLIDHGAVSEEAALQMAAGVRSLFGSDVSISITGIAGPDGGTDRKPVGLVWIGISAGPDAFAKPFRFTGNREYIRRMASDAAIMLLIDSINCRIH